MCARRRGYGASVSDSCPSRNRCAVQERPHAIAVLLTQGESAVVAVVEVPGLGAGVITGVPVDRSVRLAPGLRPDRAVDADVHHVLPGPGLGCGVGAELPVDEAGADVAGQVVGPDDGLPEPDDVASAHAGAGIAQLVVVGPAARRRVRFGGRADHQRKAEDRSNCDKGAKNAFVQGSPPFSDRSYRRRNAFTPIDDRQAMVRPPSVVRSSGSLVAWPACWVLSIRVPREGGE